MLACVAATSGIQNASSRKQDDPHAKDSKQRVDTSAWKTYRNEKYGFEIKHPETWPVQALRGTGPDIIVIGYVVSQGKPVASFTLTIQKNQNPKRLSIEEYFANQLKLANATPASWGNITIGGQPAMYMENSNSFGERHDIFTLLRETDLLSLSYTRQPEFNATYDSMVASFRILK
jgi:hypothetical protein